jgi:predicted amidohydrolase
MDPYYAAALQTATELVSTREEIKKKNIPPVLELIDNAVYLLSKITPLKLITLPEFFLTGACARKSPTTEDWLKTAIDIPGEETDILAEKAKEHGVYIVGCSNELAEEFPNRMYNCAYIIDPSGKIILKYRKINPWIPYEVCLSPHDVLDQYKQDLWPVADTPIGRLACFICNDSFHPEVARSFAVKGAEVLIRPAQWLDPWGTEPLEWHVLLARARALENSCYMVAPDSGGNIRQLPMTSRPGKSMIIDFEGRILAQAERGEAIVGAIINVDSLRKYREKSLCSYGNAYAQIRTEAYTIYKNTMYPPNQWINKKPTYQSIEDIINTTKNKINKNKKK